MAGGGTGCGAGAAQYWLRVMAEQYAQLILGLSNLALKIRQVRFGDGELRLRGRDIEFGHRSAVMLRLSQVDKFLPRADRAMRDRELLIESLQREIGGGDACDQSRQHILLCVSGLQELCAGCLGGAAILAPEIDFVGEAAFERKRIAERRESRG